MIPPSRFHFSSLASLLQHRIAWLVGLQLAVAATALCISIKSGSGDEWADDIYPIVRANCLDCHTGDDAEGSLDLSAFTETRHVANHRRQWKMIAERIRVNQMPPADGPEMSDADRRRLLDWVDRRLPTLSCTHTSHAGPVTIRRLTRNEYKNTVRDLLGVECQLADDFPADEVGYGFDNIGDVLSVSPLLLEKYLAAAESISQQVIFDPSQHRINLKRSGAELTPTRGSRAVQNAHVLTTNGRVTWSVDVPADGQYKIKIEAFGQHAGRDWVEMGLAVGGREVDTAEVKSERRKPSKHDFETKLVAGKTELGISFNNDYYNPDHPVRSQRDRNLIVVEVGIEGPIDADKQSRPEPHNRFMRTGSETDAKAAQTETDRVQKILSNRGSQAFRRPISADEIDRLTRIFNVARSNGESFEGAMQVVLQTMLVSPHFLFKVESPPPTDGTPRRLSDFELATTVSYFLWGSMPDEELFRTAVEGRLTDPFVLTAQVSRMLEDSRSDWLIDNFATQWLQLRQLDDIQPDTELFPSFNERLRKSMLQETKHLIRDVVRNGRPLTLLLTADYTFLDRRLARHYGLPTKDLKWGEFRRVSLADTSRRGLLSHASILTMTSNPTRTSPVKRGKWVLENLLADPPPPAQPDVPPLDSQSELTGTLRERMEQHRADPNCAACHVKMDAIGFALERFDPTGRQRATDDGQPIDSSSRLPDGSEFDGAIELQHHIATKMKREFVRCVCEKLFTFAVGRGPLATDECVIDRIAHGAANDDMTFAEIVLEIIRSEPFQHRRHNVD